MLRRSTACSTARSSAESCTVLSASATSATSSRVTTRTGTPPGPRRPRRTGSPGSRTPRGAGGGWPCPWPAGSATSSGRVIDSETITVSTPWSPRVPPPAGRTAARGCRRGCCSLSCPGGRRQGNEVADVGLLPRPPGVPGRRSAWRRRSGRCRGPAWTFVEDLGESAGELLGDAGVRPLRVAQLVHLAHEAGVQPATSSISPGRSKPGSSSVVATMAGRARALAARSVRELVG